jgi:hypothetical protein
LPRASFALRCHRVGPAKVAAATTTTTTNHRVPTSKIRITTSALATVGATSPVVLAVITTEHADQAAKQPTSTASPSRHSSCTIGSTTRRIPQRRLHRR